ncbi:hypothetical protein HGA91_01800 [candidate division WWE3 bacterium]|nr:hypothetical protein [candidate division WWE3 bacterium]
MLHSGLRIFAFVISRIFSPFVAIPLLLFYLLFNNTNLNSYQQLHYFPVIVGFNYVAPIGLFLFFRWKRWISDLEVRTWSQRLILLTLVSFVSWIGVLFAFVVGLPSLFVSLLGYEVLVLTALTFLSRYTKVSLHIGINSALYFIIVQIFGATWWWLCVVLILIGWARWYLKHHTVSQLLLGFFSAGAVFLTGGFAMLE